MHAIIALSEMEMGERAMPVPDMPKNSGLSLALIGNASGKDHGTKEERDPRHFRQETRRKRLAFAAGFEWQFGTQSRAGRATANWRGCAWIFDSVTSNRRNADGRRRIS